MRQLGNYRWHKKHTTGQALTLRKAVSNYINGFHSNTNIFFHPHLLQLHQSCQTITILNPAISFCKMIDFLFQNIIDAKTYKLLMGIVTNSGYCLNSNRSEIIKQDVNELLRFFWDCTHRTDNILTQTYNPNQLQDIEQQFNQICHQSFEKATLQLASPHNIHIYYRFDCLLLAGEIRNGYLEGRGIVVFADNKWYIGQFKEGRFGERGEFRVVNYIKSKKVQVKIQTLRDQQNIQLTIEIMGSRARLFSMVSKHKLQQKQYKYVKYKNQDEYIGQWKDGFPHGEGKYYYKNGQDNALFPYYEGQFVRGQREGAGTLFYDANKFLRIMWSEGKPFGYGQLVVNAFHERVLFRNGQRIYQKVSELDIV